MTTRTITRTTRNSQNAGLTPDIAFGRRATTRPATAPNRNNSNQTTTDNGNGDNPDDDGDGSGQEGDLPGGPDDDPPDDDGPGDQSDNPDNSVDEQQNNLADAISTLARNVQQQGDGSRSKA